MYGKHSPSQPIGIFDSGIGGLTVAHALIKALPLEDMIYFGDTAHLPYGDKSTKAIQSYAVKIAHFLKERQCKLILIACHSASAAAFEIVQQEMNGQVQVINMIDPVIQLLETHYRAKRVGLIGTRQTVSSQIYQKKIQASDLEVDLSSCPTNLLASAIEEFGDHHIIDTLLNVYLAHPNLQNIDALILGCTHYPLIKQRVLSYYKNPITIIDPSDIVAQTVKQALTSHRLLNSDGGQYKHFYVSDYTASFAANAKLFFGENIRLEHQLL